MFYSGFAKKGGWNKIPESDQQHILEIYLQVKSIENTAKIVKHSKSYVNKIVKPISSKSTYSRYNKNIVCQIDLETGEIIKEFPNGHIAAQKLYLNYISLNRCLNGYINNCGGYGWCYKRNIKDYKLPKEYKIEIYSSKKVDKLLGIVEEY